MRTVCVNTAGKSNTMEIFFFKYIFNNELNLFLWDIVYAYVCVCILHIQSIKLLAIVISSETGFVLLNAQDISVKLES